jgi:hypothetical protein
VESRIYGEQVLDALKGIFPAGTHPKTAVFLDGPTCRKVRLIFRLRNIAAHGGSVWTEMELPTTAKEKTKSSEFFRDNYESLFTEIAALGYDFSSADGVDGLTQLFSHTAVVDQICSGAVLFFVEFLAILGTESENDATAFHNAGVLWPEVARAFTGEARFI